MVLNSLTEYEVKGFFQPYNLADGHANQDLHFSLREVINNLPKIWIDVTNKSVPELEGDFKATYAELINSPSLKSYSNFSICPTASNSIDIISSWLNMQKKTVGLIEPAFDNLHLLLLRRGNKLERISENDFLDLRSLKVKVQEKKIGTLFIVSPNNPTGFQLSEEAFVKLCDFCIEMNINLVCDFCFRFFDRNPYDNYDILIKKKVKFISIEDTGKTWPTGDLKVSILAYHPEFSKDIRMLYEEIYLCTSKISLGILAEMIKVTKEVGLQNVIWNDLDRNIKLLRVSLENSNLIITENKDSVQLPVVWVDCSKSCCNDIELVGYLNGYGVSVLPGRHFYWSSPLLFNNNVRFSIFKPREELIRGLTVLTEKIKNI